MSIKDMGTDCDGDCENCDLDKIHNAQIFVINIEVGQSTKDKMQRMMDYIGEYIEANPEDYKDVEVRFSGRMVRRMPVKGSSRTSVNIVAVRSPEELMDFLKTIFGGEEPPKELQDLLRDAEGPEAERLLKEYLERNK